MSPSLSAAAAAAVPTLKMGKPSTSKQTSYLYFDSLNQNRQLDELLVRAIFSSGLLLLLVESEDWTTFMEKLHPSYKLPSRPMLSEKLLEN
jgi:hypothetical protein